MAPVRAYRRGTAVHSLVTTDEHIFFCAEPRLHRSRGQLRLHHRLPRGGGCYFASPTAIPHGGLLPMSSVLRNAHRRSVAGARLPHVLVASLSSIACAQGLRRVARPRAVPVKQKRRPPEAGAHSRARPCSTMTRKVLLGGGRRPGGGQGDCRHGPTANDLGSRLGGGVVTRAPQNLGGGRAVWEKGLN